MSTPNDLTALLDSAEELPLEGGQRRSVIDWSALAEQRTGDGYFTIGEVSKEIEAGFVEDGLTGEDGKPKKVHYSQVMGWLQRLGKKANGLKVTKKRLSTGPHKGTYYRIDALETDE